MAGPHNREHSDSSESEGNSGSDNEDGDNKQESEQTSKDDQDTTMSNVSVCDLLHELAYHAYNLSVSSIFVFVKRKRRYSLGLRVVWPCSSPSKI